MKKELQAETCNSLFFLVGRGGIEPPTFGLRVLSSMVMLYLLKLNEIY